MMGVSTMMAYQRAPLFQAPGIASDANQKTRNQKLETRTRRSPSGFWFLVSGFWFLVFLFPFATTNRLK